MSIIGDPAIAGHANWNRFPGLVRFAMNHGQRRPSATIRVRRPRLPQEVERRIYQYAPEAGVRMAQYYGQVKRKKKKTYKKRTCCQYIKGKKRCSPRYCPKKRYKKFYYWY